MSIELVAQPASQAPLSRYINVSDVQNYHDLRNAREQKPLFDLQWTMLSLSTL